MENLISHRKNDLLLCFHGQRHALSLEGPWHLSSGLLTLVLQAHTAVEAGHSQGNCYSNEGHSALPILGFS